MGLICRNKCKGINASVVKEEFCDKTGKLKVFMLGWFLQRTFLHSFMFGGNVEAGICGATFHKRVSINKSIKRYIELESLRYQKASFSLPDIRTGLWH